jgi:precorrin-3B synthase
MESGDGWIVRVRPGVRTLSAADVRRLASSAKAYGNGQLELTRRANLQIRGVTIEALPALQTELVRLGLAEAGPEEERSASLLVNPLSDLDADCAALGPLALEIERVLRIAESPGGLPAKFSLLLDGGGCVLDGVSADIRVDLRTTDQNVAYLSVGDRGAQFLPIGSCRKADAPLAIQALVQTLSSFQDEKKQRMRDLVALHGVDVVRAAAAPWLLDRRAAPASLSRKSVIGFQTGTRSWLGLGLPFGSGDSEAWNGIADIAERFGSGHVRLTPKRSVVIPDVQPDHRLEILAAASDRGLLVDESDPLLRVTACVGAPACRASFGETRTLARELSEIVRPLLAAGATVHVSGCNKSCALTGYASVTVVRDQKGCRLGLDVDVAGTSASGVVSLAIARRKLTGLAQDFRDATASRDVSQFLRAFVTPV